MDIDLTCLWNGRRPPQGFGGRARLALRQSRLTLSWDIRAHVPPRIPEGPAGFTERLWEWDVVELFLMADADAEAESPRYVELEFGAGGHWIALAFAGRRELARELRDIGPLVISDVQPGAWRGQAEVSLPALEQHVGPWPWRGLVAAVVPGPTVGSGTRERLHLCWPSVPGLRPDFHQPSSWARLNLDRRR